MTSPPSDATSSVPMVTQHEEVNDETAILKAEVIVGSVVLSMTMRTALELGLFEIIARKEKESMGLVTASEVVAELKTDNPSAPNMVERILSLLATNDVVSCSVEVGRGKVFGMTQVGRQFLTHEDGMSLGPIAKMMHDKVFMEGWYKLKDAVLEGGIAFEKAHGLNVFEYAGTDPRFNRVFNEAMSNNCPVMMTKILQSYKGFENIDRLVDVGGGLGHNLKVIMSSYPSIKGINFDLPHVIDHGISYPGMEHIAGDMFDNVPQADAIFMRWILHDWSDDHCLKLLKNCYQALPPNGKVIVVDSILPEKFECTAVARIICQIDLQMLANHEGGKERTKDEFLALAVAAGFVGIRFEAKVGAVSIMEFYK